MGRVTLNTDTRHVCTAADPWTPAKGPRAEHPDAVYKDDFDYGHGEYCERYVCPNCGMNFQVELPQ